MIAQMQKELSDYFGMTRALSGAMRMQHNTTMGIIDNIRPSSTERWNPVSGDWERRR